LEKDYKILFENKQYLIKDANEKDLFKVKIKKIIFFSVELDKELMSFESKGNVTLKKKKKKHDDSIENVKKINCNRNNDIEKAVVNLKD